GGAVTSELWTPVCSPEAFCRARFARDDADAIDFVRLLLLEQALPAGRANALLSPRLVETFLHHHLFAETEGGIASNAIVFPWEGRVFIADHYSRQDEPGAVFLPDPSSYAPAGLFEAVTSRRGRALDIGTGSGLLAIKLAETFDEVLAID